MRVTIVSGDPPPKALGTLALPSALVVKEEDKVEVLACFLSHLLPQLQHLQGGHRDGDTMMEHAFPRHLGVNDLQKEQGRAERRTKTRRASLQGGDKYLRDPDDRQYSPTQGRRGNPGT